MKLIDLLVKELPKRGGWPEGVKEVEQDSDGSIFEMDSDYISDFSFKKTEDWRTASVTKSKYESALAASDGWIEWGGGECPVERGCVVDYKVQGCEGVLCGNSHRLRWSHDADWQSGNIIAYRLHREINTRANDDRLEQDLNECIGQDMDPAWNGEGLPPVGAECEALYDTHRNEWVKSRIIAHDSGGVIGRWLDGDKCNELFDYSMPDGSFRPLRTEGEKLREKSIKEIDAACRECPHQEAIAEHIYEYIAAGKFTGVKLEDK